MGYREAGFIVVLLVTAASAFSVGRAFEWRTNPSFTSLTEALKSNDTAYDALRGSLSEFAAKCAQEPTHG